MCLKMNQSKMTSYSMGCSDRDYFIECISMISRKISYWHNYMYVPGWCFNHCLLCILIFIHV